MFKMYMYMENTEGFKLDVGQEYDLSRAGCTSEYRR